MQRCSPVYRASGTGTVGVSTLRYGQRLGEGWRTAQNAVVCADSHGPEQGSLPSRSRWSGRVSQGWCLLLASQQDGWAMGMWPKCLLHPSGCRNGASPDPCNGDLWGWSFISADNIHRVGAYYYLHMSILTAYSSTFCVKTPAKSAEENGTIEVSVQASSDFECWDILGFSKIHKEGRCF